MAVPACCRTARARGAVPTGRQSGRSTSANDPPAHVHRARRCITARPVRLAVVPSSTQFLPLNRTESVDFHRFNQRVFQQNLFVTDGHEVFIVPSIRLTVAARNLEKQWTWESKRA